MTNKDGEVSGAPLSSAAERSASAEKREADAIYQKNSVVARTEGEEISADGKSIFFHEINSSDHLLLPDECEFREYRLVIRKIGYATKVERHSLEKGRILQDVRAEVLGYRKQ